MTDIEIPYENERKGWYRFFEILPGLISWTMLIVPFLLSLIDVRFAAMFVFVYLLINFARGMAGAFRALQGYRIMQQHQKLPWTDMMRELGEGLVPPRVHRPKWHREVIQRLGTKGLLMQPNEVIHAVIIATVKESREVLEPTIQSVIDAEYDAKQILFILAYEERAGESTEKQALELVSKYKHHFLDAGDAEHSAVELSRRTRRQSGPARNHRPDAR